MIPQTPNPTRSILKKALNLGTTLEDKKLQIL